jgi:hypothetical protein
MGSHHARLAAKFRPFRTELQLTNPKGDEEVTRSIESLIDPGKNPKAVDDLYKRKNEIVP